MEHVETKVSKSNFSKSQWNSLKELCEDEAIIIKEADKGNAVVIMDTLDHKTLIMDL